MGKSRGKTNHLAISNPGSENARSAKKTEKKKTSSTRKISAGIYPDAKTARKKMKEGTYRLQVGMEAPPHIAKIFGVDTTKNVKKSGSIGIGYNNIPKGVNGWVDASKILPLDYELVYIRMYDDTRIKGWWEETGWRSLRIRKEDRGKVISWKFTL